ncbi:cytochrome P450 [Streptomyces sp. NRRL B-1347]|uniref:cytochrome P450 n=1 Tax=Streptomyces sp. NRRL B-1347 TaxID=1476877 RepID=UPI00068D88EC|nr:cytochrome P450 [Streptomyces sp. NRRL B-1347]
MSTEYNSGVAQFSVNAPEFEEDRYRIYRELRENEPLFWHEETQSWFITRYEDVSKLLVGERFITSRLVPAKMDLVPEAERAEFSDIIDIISTWMVYNDRPRHAQLRGHMNRAFLSAEIALIQPEIAKIVSEQLDDVLLRNGTEFEFVAEVAHPIPALVLCKMLGIPGDEVKRFIRWSDDIADFMQDFVVSPVPDREISDRTRQSMREIVSYLTDAIAERRATPRNDLLSRLISEQPGEGGQLLDSEVMTQVIHLIFGGHKIPQFLLSNCLHLLFRTPDALDAVRRVPEKLLTPAVEEAIRLEGPTQFITRHAAEDVELHGKTIKKGDSVYFYLGAAGRDPDAFDAPEAFRLDRSGRRHLGFGGGYHACIAAAFSRVEVEEVLRGVLARVPDIRPRYDLDGPRWTSNPTFHGILDMPVSVAASDVLPETGAALATGASE